METVLYPFFHLTTRASEPAEEYITDDQLVFIIDGKATLRQEGDAILNKVMYFF
jgi:hypothetical protein